MQEAYEFAVKLGDRQINVKAANFEELRAKVIKEFTIVLQNELKMESFDEGINETISLVDESDFFDLVQNAKNFPIIVTIMYGMER